MGYAPSNLVLFSLALDRAPVCRALPDYILVAGIALFDLSYSALPYFPQVRKMLYLSLKRGRVTHEFPLLFADIASLIAILTPMPAFALGLRAFGAGFGTLLHTYTDVSLTAASVHAYAGPTRHFVLWAPGENLVGAHHETTRHFKYRRAPDMRDPPQICFSLRSSKTTMDHSMTGCSAAANAVDLPTLIPLRAHESYVSARAFCRLCSEPDMGRRLMLTFLKHPSTHERR